MCNDTICRIYFGAGHLYGGSKWRLYGWTHYGSGEWWAVVTVLLYGVVVTGWSWSYAGQSRVIDAAV